ncbi:dipeptidase D [Abditibacterium utsteinense]|uniref:Cytosol non-specific dipeptidase n=1 Tax=Abditibacterium utsteinense TaxID=1960156 RepID=A0A2S8SVZ2_9BACT|nr:aminoacyl-histidine dipeptidase [Abditibacterium utsteinense]PQV64961.1 dipeptidase D [Abditibacterium utsteinense]
MTNFPPVYEGLQPAAVWRHFGALNQIPRLSGNEAKAREWICGLATKNGASFETDARGNLCVRVPARGARADAPIVTLQSHLDMVCQKRPEVAHNFETDPILPQRNGDKITATSTTLGADNGLGVALMLAVLTSDELKHGPLELLFTVEEETGLHGAMNLDPALVRGRLLVNLDSEDPDEITIGCAGGAETFLYLPAQRSEIEAAASYFKIGVSGLQGGHSGIQIGERLANALKLLGELLDGAAQNCAGMRLVSVDGGTAHNAIPRDASATIAIPARDIEAFESAFARISQKIKEEWNAFEPGLRLTRENAQQPAHLAPLTEATSVQLLSLLRDLPHGALQMSERFAGKVQTSCNLAEVHSRAQEIEIALSGRSFLNDEIRALQEEIRETGLAAGARVEMLSGYPGWEPRADSPLLDATKAAFKSSTGRAPHIEVVHAGLECGLLSEKLPGLDAVSFGPLIRGAHTPEESVTISSVEEIYGVLTTLLRDLA